MPGEAHLELLEPAQNLAVDTDEVLQHIRLACNPDEEELSGNLEGYIKSATQTIENITGKVLIKQKWRQTEDHTYSYDSIDEKFDRIKYGRDTRRQRNNFIRLMKRPVLDITEIRYIDDNHEEKVWDSDNYVLADHRLRAKELFPQHREFASFIIEFEAGYGEDAADVPLQLQQAVKKLTATMYEDRRYFEQLQLKDESITLQDLPAHIRTDVSHYITRGGW